jgi:hypothetical protein
MKCIFVYETERISTATTADRPNPFCVYFNEEVRGLKFQRKTGKFVCNVFYISLCYIKKYFCFAGVVEDQIFFEKDTFCYNGGREGVQLLFLGFKYISKINLYENTNSINLLKN